MNCKRCGRNVPQSSKVCPNCGLDNPNWKPSVGSEYKQSGNGKNINQCNRCGRNVPITSRVCTNCGLDNPNWKPPVEPHFSQPKAQSAGTSNNTNNNNKGSWKTILLIAIVLVLIIFFVKQCSGERLKGTWVAETGDHSVTFTDDINGYISQDGIVLNASDRNMNFTYYIDGDELELKTETTLFSNSEVIRFEFEIDGNKLILTEVESGYAEVYYKE